MALIQCPECGKLISSQAKMCIGCGFPLESLAPKESKLIIKAQRNPGDFLPKQLTYDIFTTTGQKICTIEPGRILHFDITENMEIYAIPTYGFAKEKRKTNSLQISVNQITKVQLTFIRTAFGTSVQARLNEVDDVNFI